MRRRSGSPARFAGNTVAAATQFGIAADGFRLAVPRTYTVLARYTNLVWFAVEWLDAVLVRPTDAIGSAISRLRAAFENIRFAATGGLATGVATRRLLRGRMEQIKCV